MWCIRREQKLFEQAIFILKDGAVGQGITDEALLKEAQCAIRSPDKSARKRRLYLSGAVWALGGAMVMGLVAGYGASVKRNQSAAPENAGAERNE